ncbi:hypothetical protein B0A50_07048 [Salinomyces thailandicus]|uniref:Glycosyltransferase family 34 protein n=1 Tax=Salinomyces thailandicus TaxID=706561 RepID=A0A4U0TPJ1_9PEZI|nr:hypothetical protein B0A50_07048 [Salinomyces thailandica]
MLAGAGGSASQVHKQLRNIVFAAAVVVTLFILLQSFHIGTHEIQHTTSQSLQVINSFTPTAWRRPTSKVTKVTALFGEENEIYEAAIRSHEEHNRLHNYPIRILRERIINNFWSKPAYLLSLVIEELAKPPSTRSAWLVWFGPDIILLNPHIPLELFLPPPDFPNLHFIGTHDPTGLNTGIFFLSVSEWSVNLLIDVLALPKTSSSSSSPSLASATDKDQAALQQTLTLPAYRAAVVYQPRAWFNTYQLSATHFEGHPGNLLVHFHDLDGDRWSSMSHYLAQISQPNSTWRVPLSLTTYESEVEEFWDRLRSAGTLLDESQRQFGVEGVEEKARRLGYAFHFEADVEGTMLRAMDDLKVAMGIREGEKVV